MTMLRILAFGDIATETWGVSWMTEGPGPFRLAVGIGAAARIFDVKLSQADGSGWQAEGPGVLLSFRAAGPSVVSHDPQGRLEREDQLCEVEGRLQIGENAELASLGWMSSARSEAELAEFDSLRFLAAWLDPQAGFSLTAIRPRKARGQEADVVAAALVDDPPSLVIDPRLSTTYSDQGTPARAGLELWLEAESGDREGETSLQYPRRAAGEATGARQDWNQGDLALHASLLRWRSHGKEGPGVYVLGRRQ